VDWSLGWVVLGIGGAVVGLSLLGHLLHAWTLWRVLTKGR
jgi:hypothetical protein